MCGFAGIVFQDRLRIDRESVSLMLASLARRGPDAEGMAAWPGVVLGHRRLSIIDLSKAGHQPMLSEDGRLGLVFNGCIYNFLEIRRELEQRGHRFRSQCDTEVLLRGYQEWGIHALVPRLRGMFAFAIWDDACETLTLVRDRLGVKPLVYAAKGNQIAFASTLAALKAAALVHDLDPDTVLEYLEFGFATDERSIYSGTRKLPAATILEWKKGQISERCYWSIPQINETLPIRFEEAVEETERLIVECVRMRLCADVPIGALLSGGIDSSLVCWAMTQLNADVKAFTVATPGEASDESCEAKKTATRLGVSHETVTIADGPPPLEELLTAYSEPFACQSALGMLRVSRAVRPHATVLLTGDGGDDVFFGYPFFYNAWRAQQLARRLPRITATAWPFARRIVGMIPNLHRGRNFLDYAIGGLASYNRVREGLTYFEKRNLLGERLERRHLAQRSLQPSFASARRLLSDVFSYHCKTHFASEFMTKVDGATMYHALEGRAPFLDHKIWEFAAALPASIRLRNGTLKAVLREIARRRLGVEIASRRKKGFTVPAEKWLAGRWRSTLQALQSGTLLVSQGWIQQQALKAEIDKVLTTGRAPTQLWYLLVLEQWLKKQQSSLGQTQPALNNEAHINRIIINCER